MEENIRVTLNVGGQRFMTFYSTLTRILGTRLSELTTEDPNYNTENQEYFFDRNPRLFPYVLDAFRDGEIHFPRCVCAPALLAELRFWGLEDGRISACCWKSCCDWDEEQKTLAVIDDAYGGERMQLDEGLDMAKGTWRDRMNDIWLFLDDPHSSKLAKIWSFFFLMLLVLSAMVISLETCESLRVPATRDLEGVLGESWNTSNPKIDKYHNSEEHPVLGYINHFCSVFFFIELLARFLCSPRKLLFFWSFFNVVDILAVVPMFVLSLISFVQPYFWVENNLEVSYNVVGLVAILRAVRVLKMVKHSRGLQVICLAMRASLHELLLLGLLVAIGMLIFSTAIYFAELYQPERFESIPVGFWWSLITMTTVGYGDVTPVTAWGQIIAGVCAVCGILITGLPIPVIANNFRLYYTYASLRTKLEQRTLNKAASDTKSAVHANS